VKKGGREKEHLKKDEKRKTSKFSWDVWNRGRSERAGALGEAEGWVVRRDGGQSVLKKKCSSRPGREEKESGTVDQNH